MAARILAFLIALTGTTAAFAGAAVDAQAGGTHGGLVVRDLRVNQLHEPLGIDDPRPEFGWKLRSERRNRAQKAYRILVASRRGLLAPGKADVWDSGKVRSRNSIAVPYEGRDLRSRERLWWAVRVWDERGRPSAWSEPASWEMGLLRNEDWEAEWISHPEWLAKDEVNPLVIRFDARPTRFIRLAVTRLGLPAPGEGFPQPVSRLQLAEFQAFADGELASEGATATASESLEVPGVWGLDALLDGKLTSEGAPHGYTSEHRFQQDLDEPIWIEIDLGAVADVDEVRLYPRTEVLTADGEVPNFPEDFTLETKAQAGDEWVLAYEVQGQERPPAPRVPEALPILARGFEVRGEVERARLYATGLGVYEARLNGRKVGDAVLEPANTDFNDRVHYTTYDVTDLIRRGPNTVGFELGNGIYNVPATPGRYQKFTGSMGPPKLIAQLEVTYADGSTQTIASDQSWRAALGPVTFSGWYGGEDHDARREIRGWDRPGASHDGDRWVAAERTSPPSPETELAAQEAPPVRVQETLTAISREEVAPGVWLFDLGRNIAGWPQITVRGAEGRSVRLVPGERLTDGRVDQRQSGGPAYFEYTARSDGEETWHPRFAYYGFRWIEVSGLDQPPDLDDVKGLVLRADNPRAGALETSDPLLNSVHRLVVRAIESNMYSVLTDCPHREKLGWLEETHLMFDGIAANFEVGNYYRQIVQAMADAQLPSGLVPDIAPEYTVFGGGFRDDPNWGGAIILAPWRMYQRYGDVEVLREHYDSMQRYMDYLATRADGHILSHGLGDWGAFDDSTPVAIPVTTVYFRMAEAMSEIARLVGDDEGSARYRQLADDIRAAFNARFLDSDRGSYGSGSQASNALPLAAGMVPADQRDAVLAALIADIAARDGHLSTGEVGLRALLDALGDAGRADTVLDIATNPTPPSYAHMVESGATTLPEFWDLAGSLNHFMMGAIDDWMYRYLAGIQPAAPGFKRISIKPLVPARLDRVQASWPSPYGAIRSTWRRTGSALHFEVEVPVSTEARVEIPLGADDKPPAASGGAKPVRIADGRAVYELGSGEWRFVVTEPR